MKIERKENEERTTETALVPVDQPEEEKMDEVRKFHLLSTFKFLFLKKKRGTLAQRENVFDLKLYDLEIGLQILIKWKRDNSGIF